VVVGKFVPEKGVVVGSRVSTLPSSIEGSWITAPDAVMVASGKELARFWLRASTKESPAAVIVSALISV